MCESARAGYWAVKKRRETRIAHVMTKRLNVERMDRGVMQKAPSLRRKPTNVCQVPKNAMEARAFDGQTCTHSMLHLKYGAFAKSEASWYDEEQSRQGTRP
jgi:pyridoxine 5'-phosphate synthase PdxJ